MPQPTDTAPPTDLRQALLHSLGLPADATPEAVEAAHERVAGYLTKAPAELRPWAEQQAAAADAAHAVLTGKAGDVLASTTGPARTAGASASGNGRPGLAKALANPLILLAIIAAIVVGVYKWGPSGTTAATPAVPMGSQATSSATAPAPATPTPVDPAKIKALQAKVTANPKDVESLARIGDMYFAAEDYKNAAAYRQKIVDIDPKNTDALLATGVALFNGGDVKGAEAAWTKATTIDPKKAEAYYDLGFLELSKTPPNSTRAKEYWDKVIELDGNGPLAQKVQNHMGALMTPAPTAPGTGTASTSKS